MILAQVEALGPLITSLQTGGPWAILALAILAIIWLARSYVQARDERDAAVSNLNEKLSGLLKDMVSAAEQQKAANEKVVDLLERIERRFDGLEK